MFISSQNKSQINSIWTIMIILLILFGKKVGGWWCAVWFSTAEAAAVSNDQGIRREVQYNEFKSFFASY